MKTRIYKSILALAIMFVTLPMTAQDFMNIYFKNGDFRKFYMKNITEISASKMDADGVLHSDYNYQHITTIYDRYVYNLGDVDSITFTDIDEQKAEENFVSAMPVVFDAISDCETIDDVEDKIDQIKNAEGVADAWSDGHQLYVAIGEGETFSFHFSHDDADIDDEEDFSNVANQVKAFLPQLKTAVKKDGTQLKAVIANQQHKDISRDWHKTSYFNPLKKEMEDCNILVDYVDEPTIDFFYDHCKNPENANHLNLYDYDVIFLITHGSYGDLLYFDVDRNEFASYGFKAHQFLTSEDVLRIESSELPDWWKNFYRSIKAWRDAKGYNNATDQHIQIGFTGELRNNQGNNISWIGHPNLTEFFFRDIVPNKTRFSNPNSIFFNVACQSMMGDGLDAAMSMANIFTQERGLGVYYGYNESNYRGQGAGYEFFKSMLRGKSISKSFSDLDDSYKLESDKPEHAGLTRWPAGENGDQFLFPTVTQKVDQEAAETQFKNVNYVEVVGYATSLDYTKLSYGFVYGTDKNNLSSITNVTNENNDILQLNQVLENGNGNIRFRGKLTNLKPGNTYYYRAYTYDGLNYNYGKICSFEISSPNQPVTGITLRPTSLTLTLPTTPTSTITATVLPSNATNKNVTWSSNNTGVATVDQSGNVTAKSPGSCTITCTAQDGSGKSATCSVTVKQLVTGITLSPSSLTLTKGSTHTLTADVQPTNASNKSVKWKSSNTGVATVDQSGNVTAKSVGSCAITATAADGSGVEAKCVVKVNSDQTYTYSYDPPMGSYTHTGSGTSEHEAINYNNGSLAGGTTDYTNGQIKATVISHTSGTITFSVAKENGYFRKGNSGKIFILNASIDGGIYSTPFSISDSTTPSVTATLTNYGDFTGTRKFEIFLITSDQVYKQYGGIISITGSIK